MPGGVRIVGQAFTARTRVDDYGAVRGTDDRLAKVVLVGLVGADVEPARRVEVVLGLKDVVEQGEILEAL
jgi:hypothetical protein